MNIKKSLSGLVFFLLMVTLWRYFKEPLVEGDESLLTLGTVGGYAPFVSVNEQGAYEGFDVDVAYAVAKQMGKKLVLKDLGSMTSLLTALEQGTIDGAIWGLSITQERLTKVTMVRYQGDQTSSYPMLFWQQIPAGVSDITDMRGMTVCVEPNSSQDAVLQKYDFITIKPTEKVDDALLNLQYGKVDAAFVEPAIGNKFKRCYPQIQIMAVELAPDDQVQGIGIAVRKDKAMLIERMQEAIAALRAAGTIQQFESRWGIE